MDIELESLREEVLEHCAELGFRGFRGHGGFHVEPGGPKPVGAGDLKILYVVSIHQEALQGNPGIVNAARVSGAGASWGVGDDDVRRTRGGRLDGGCFEDQLLRGESATEED